MFTYEQMTDGNGTCLACEKWFCLRWMDEYPFGTNAIRLVWKEPYVIVLHSWPDSTRPGREWWKGMVKAKRKEQVTTCKVLGDGRAVELQIKCMCEGSKSITWISDISFLRVLASVTLMNYTHLQTTWQCPLLLAHVTLSSCLLLSHLQVKQITANR